MHRSSLLMLAALGALALAGCASLPGQTSVGTTPTLPGTPAPEPSKVKRLVMQGCGFVPTIETIASIVTASPFVPAAGAVAESICQAVTNIPFADGPGDHKPRVNGVVVQGYFLKR